MHILEIFNKMNKTIELRNLKFANKTMISNKLTHFL